LWDQQGLIPAYLLPILEGRAPDDVSLQALSSDQVEPEHCISSPDSGFEKGYGLGDFQSLPSPRQRRREDKLLSGPAAHCQEDSFHLGHDVSVSRCLLSKLLQDRRMACSSILPTNVLLY
jgi:hypothetical protein